MNIESRINEIKEKITELNSFAEDLLKSFENPDYDEGIRIDASAIREVAQSIESLAWEYFPECPLPVDYLVPDYDPDLDNLPF